MANDTYTDMSSNTAVETVWPPTLSMNTDGLGTNGHLPQQNESHKQPQQQLPTPSSWGFIGNGHCQNQHPGQPKLRGSCDGCQESKLKCSRHRPCHRCADHNIPCVYSAYRRVGRPRKSASSRINTSTTKAPVQSNSTSNTEISKASSQSPPRALHSYQADTFAQTFNTTSEVNTEQWLPAVPELNSLFSTFSDPSEWLDVDLNQTDGLGGSLSPEPMLTQDPYTGLGFTDFLSQDITKPSSSNVVDSMRLAVKQGDLQRPVSRSVPSSTAPTPSSAVCPNPSMTTLTDLDILMSDVTPQLMQHSAASNSFCNRQFPLLSQTTGPACQNKCVELISGQLAAMPAKPAQYMTIDALLTIEKAILPIREAICSCKTCQGNQVIMLMLSMLVEQTMACFESFSNCPQLSSKERFNLAHPMDTEWSSKKANAAPPYELDNALRSTLTLQQHGAGEAVNADFVAKVLKYSLDRTVGHLLVLQERINHSALIEYNAHAVRSIAENAYRRTEILRGMAGMRK